MKYTAMRYVVVVFCMLMCDVHDQYGVFGFQNFDLATETFTIDASGDYEFANNREYSYTPTNIGTGSPLVKITASDVMIDFKYIGVTNQDNTHAGWIGVEIGWTPQELIDDPARIQPKNITIKNLALYNFDCALLVHAGVEGVYVKDCKFYKTLLGIGAFGLANDFCKDIYFEKVTIFGISGDYHSALQNFKTRIETDFAYGADYFMPLQPDPLNSDTVDAHTYYGMFLACTNNTCLKNVRVSGIGYEDYETTSEGNTNRTEAISICMKDTQRVEMCDTFVADTASEIKAVGLQLDNVQEITIKNSDFSYAKSSVKAVGIEVTNNGALPYSVSAMSLDKVETKSNVAGDIAIGMDLSCVRGFRGKDLVSKFNNGDKQAYGVYTNKMYTVDINKAKFSENNATRTTNDVATTHGIVAAGFYGININSFQNDNVDYTSMQAFNSAYGLYLKDSSSCKFDNCQFVANIATTMRSGEAAAIRSEQDAQEISMLAPIVDSTSTGGYGAFMDNCMYIKFEKCMANSNVGHRAVGISARNCRAVAVWNSICSTQNATGAMFDSSLVTDITDPTAFPINLVHKALLFGDFTKSTVDVVKTTDLFLEKLQAVRTAQAAANSPSYDDVVSMMATSSLLKATVARYRLWGVAMGVHVHNVSGFLLRDCTCVGQVSLFDNAFGMCFSGRNTGHSIDDCKLSFNGGGYYSLQTPVVGQPYAYSYNLIGMKPFWDMVLQSQVPWTVFKSGDLTVDATAVAFSADHTRLAVGTGGNEIKIYDTTSWSLLQTLTGHTAPITSLSWSADGTKLASGASSATNNIKIWNTSTWVADQTLTHGSVGVNSVHFKGDSTQLASGSLDTTDNIKIWNTSTWVADQTLTHGVLSVNTVKYSSDGTKLASGSSDLSNNIKVWNTSTWVADQTLNSHTDAVNSVHWNSDDSQLASGSSDDTAKVWETTGWTVSQTLSPALGNINAVQFKPDDSLLAVGCATNAVRVYKTSDWSAEETLTDFTEAVLGLSWIGNHGRLLATVSSDNLYRVYATNIYKRATTTSEVGLYAESGNYKLQDSLSFGSAITDASVFIDLLGTKYPLVSPIGPIGAGLVIGDLMVEAFARRNYMYGNYGNAGHAYGVVLNKGFSVTLDGNLMSGNNTNAHGFATGILDITAHSPNLYIKNFLEGNKCSTFNNANYLVPFNSADVNALAFPVKTIMNGNFSNLTNTDGWENIIVQYSQEAEFYPYESLATIPIHPDFRSHLTSNNCWS